MKNNASRFNIFAKIAICVIIVFCVVQVVNKRVEYSDRVEYQETLQEKIELYENEIEELENKLNAPFDKEYIVSVANEKLDYCFPEEVFFIVD